VRELGKVLGHLLREDGCHIIRAPRALAIERYARLWRRAYPTDQHADKIIPLRADKQQREPFSASSSKLS